MGGIGESLLLDEGVVVQPVEQLRAIRGDHLRLRIMDVDVDQPGHDKRARVIVDPGVGRRGRKNRARFPHRGDAPVVDQYRPVLDILARGGAGFSRVVGEGEDASADDSLCATHFRMSCSRSAAMRSISASAVRVSASASLTSRCSKAARMSALLLPLTAMMKGMPNRPR